jgi:hypothetical protein
MVRYLNIMVRYLRKPTCFFLSVQSLMQFSENLDWNSSHLPSTHINPTLVLAYSPYSTRNRQCAPYFGAQVLPVSSIKA